MSTYGDDTIGEGGEYDEEDEEDEEGGLTVGSTRKGVDESALLDLLDEYLVSKKKEKQIVQGKRDLSLSHTCILTSKLSSCTEFPPPRRVWSHRCGRGDDGQNEGSEDSGERRGGGREGD